MYAGERLNSITSIVGVVLAMVGTVALVVLTPHDARTVAALSVYGTMLVVLYLSSTLYHSIPGPAKKVFHVFDHCSIYLLIAGTYTPFTLVILGGVWGWSLFAVIWVLAAAGIAKAIFLHGRLRVLSPVLYIVMGWLIIIAIEPLQNKLPDAGIAWLIAGGVVYTGGILFYALSRHVMHAHGLWHLCVLAGSACHYVAVLLYVALR